MEIFQLVKFNDYRKHTAPTIGAFLVEASRVHPSGWKRGAYFKYEDIV